MIVLTADEMRAAEAKAIASGISVETLMERAGQWAAEAIWRQFGRQPTLVLCGPGNNGGDGYVIARILRNLGAPVRVASAREPASAAARSAFERWGGPVEAIAKAEPAPLLVDALFGTGLARPLDPELADRLMELAAMARFRIAIDQPSGVSSDDGKLLSPVADYDLTISFQTLKPAHLLQPAARHMGRLVVADIGIEAEGSLSAIDRPVLRPPGPDDHKYRRGYVAVIAGEMPGAAVLAASAAARAGAGYVRLLADGFAPGLPSAIVQGGQDLDGLLADPRVDCVALGPGLGRGDSERRVLDRVVTSGRPLVLDADALFLLADRGLEGLGPATILTPHEGEFERLFPGLAGSKIDRARAAAARSKSVILLKGPDTVVAAPDGRAAISASPSHWLASAGTGDVLCGIVAALKAGGPLAFEAACAATWLHGRSAERAGPALIADDLVLHLPASVRDCL